MHNRSLSIIVIMIIMLNAFCTVHLYSQERDINFSVQINPLRFFSQVLEDEFEFELDFDLRMNDYWNMKLRPNISVGEIGRNDISLSLMPGFMFRPFGTGLRGVYIGLYPNIGWQNITMNNTANNYFLIGVGAEVGHSWVFNHGFTFTLGGGVLKTRRIELNGAKRYAGDENIRQNFRLTLLLGYSF